MLKYLSTLLKLSTLFIILLMAGCSKDSSTPLAPSSRTNQPTGTITGLIKNWVSGEPVPFARISVGYNGTVQSTTSDSAGAFSFADVPAGQYEIVGGAPVFSGSYTVTVSLVNYNSAQTNPNKKYRDYYYKTTTITFTSLGQGDSSSINGMVGSLLLNVSYLNTTVKGTVVDMNMQPDSGALVTLYDETVAPAVAIAQTSTGTDGTYTFTNIDNGLTVNITAIGANGSLEGNIPAFMTLPASLVADSLREGVTVDPIRLAPIDNVSPFVINITPQNNSDVSPANLQVVYTFSEPIKQNAYTQTNLPIGSNTMLDNIVLNFIGMKKTTGAVNFAAAWNSTFSQLTITPQGLVGSARYSLDMTGVFGSAQFTDAAGNALVNNTKLTGDFELLNFTTNGGTTAPNPPNVVRRIVPGHFDPVDFDGGPIGLEWNYDQNVRSYNIYKSVDGGPYQLLQKDFYGTQFNENCGPLVVPENYVPQNQSSPIGAGSVSYEVTAVSKDLVESQVSNVINITDQVKPTLDAVTVASAGATNTWRYTLRFSEPLTVSNAETVSNYVILNPDTVSFAIVRADYLGYDAVNTTYDVQLYVTTDLPQPAGYSLRVNQTGVTDLAGNSIDTASGGNIYTFSAPPTPILLAPNSGATGLGLPVSLVWQASNGAISYRVQVSTVNTFATTVVDQSGITGTSYNVGTPALNTGTLYYWRVSARNASGTSAYTTTRQFTP
jgi:hypothetical protein